MIRRLPLILSAFGAQWLNYPVSLLMLTAPVAARQAPSFEVASVKRNQSGDTRVKQTLQPGGRYEAINIPLRMLIMRAYRLLEFRLHGPRFGVNLRVVYGGLDLQMPKVPATEAFDNVERVAVRAAAR